MAKFTIKRGTKIRTFGGWYQHDEVFVGETFVGVIQTRRRHKRTEVSTCREKSCVIGAHPEWLVREAGLGGLRGRKRR